MPDFGHGAVGTRERSFTSILPPDHRGYDAKKLAALADLIKGSPDDAKDGPDPEENLWVPAGYTYFGQFIDHDLTFDNTSSLSGSDSAEPLSSQRPTNLRSPRFDLDCVYGDGPGAQPFMYGDDGATLLLGGAGTEFNGVQGADFELPRASNGRAIIGDKRNDENSIVSQIQQGFLKFHNAVVAILGARDPASWNDPGNLFNSARNEVRWTYQQIILEDFLPRIIKHEVLADLAGKSKLDRETAYALYTEDKRLNLPREFVAAAYRFGHSGVRTGYRLNRKTILSIFPGSQPDAVPDSLIGFEPLPKSHVIDDWARFLPDTAPGVFPTEDRSKGQAPDPDVRLQLAYKLDPTIVDPLGVLPLAVAGRDTADQAARAISPLKFFEGGERPSLALLNLLRGKVYRIHGGQEYGRLLQSKFPQATMLDAGHLVVRVETPIGSGKFTFEPIDADFQADTPLWFYILAEAQAPVVDFITPQLAKDGTFDETLLLTGDGAKTQLGWVGGRIVGEVMYGLVDSDDESVVNLAPVGWKSMIGAPRLKNLLTFSAPAVS